MGTFGIVYLVLVIPANGILLSATIRSFSDASVAQQRLKHGMFLAAGAFIAGRAVEVLGVV
jgi:geranylgeranylglycerol-phosphate geranylgeranyltransferase